MDSVFETAMYLLPSDVFAVCPPRLVWDSALEWKQWRAGFETFFVCSKRCNAMIARAWPALALGKKSIVKIQYLPSRGAAIEA